MIHTSDLLLEQRETMSASRDSELWMARRVLSQYVVDHSDRAAWRNVEREVRELAKAWDKMISLLDKTIEKCQKIEESVSDFYGD